MPKPGSVVTTFRVRPSELARLATALPPIPGLDSHHLVARKLLLDFIDGKLVYLSRQDRVSAR